MAFLGRCSKCTRALGLNSYASVHGVLYCKPDFMEEFRKLLVSADDDDEDFEDALATGESHPSMSSISLMEIAISMSGALRLHRRENLGMLLFVVSKQSVVHTVGWMGAGRGGG